MYNFMTIISIGISKEETVWLELKCKYKTFLIL